MRNIKPPRFDEVMAAARRVRSALEGIAKRRRFHGSLNKLCQVGADGLMRAVHEIGIKATLVFGFVGGPEDICRLHHYWVWTPRLMLDITATQFKPIGLLAEPVHVVDLVRDGYHPFDWGDHLIRRMHLLPKRTRPSTYWAERWWRA